MPRFADLLDSACEGMVGGFWLGSLICGKKDCRRRSNTSKTALAGGVIERWVPMYLEVARDPPDGFPISVIVGPPRTLGLAVSRESRGRSVEDEGLVIRPYEPFDIEEASLRRNVI